MKALKKKISHTLTCCICSSILTIVESIHALIAAYYMTGRMVSGILLTISTLLLSISITRYFTLKEEYKREVARRNRLAAKKAAIAAKEATEQENNKKFIKTMISINEEYGGNIPKISKIS